MAETLRQREDRLALEGYQRACWDSLAFWMSRECTVKMSPFARLAPGAKGRPPVNAPQLRGCELIDRMYAAGGPVNLISLKTRKYGGSTLMEAALAREMVLVPNTSGLTIAHHKDTAREIADLYALIVLNLNIASTVAKVERRHGGWKTLTNGSRMDIQTAGSREPPAFGFAFDVLLMSELAQMKAAEKMWTAVRSAAIGARFVAVESQARGRGGLFYDMWQAAQSEEEWFAAPRGERRQCRFFVPFHECEWYQQAVPEGDAAAFAALVGNRAWMRLRERGFVADDEEEALVRVHGLSLGQLAWRRWAIAELCNGNAETFREQFPVDAETAFLVGGRPIIPLEVLERRRAGVREPLSRGTVRDGCYREGEGEGDVWMWEEPEEGCHYAQGMDTATGDPKGDNSVDQVFRRSPRRQVCEFAGHVEPRRLAEVANALGRLYNDAPTASERDGVNYAALERLASDYEYPDVYRYMDEDTVKLGNEVPKLGIKVSSRIREMLTDRGRAAISDPEIEIFSSRLVDEFCTLVYDSAGRINHGPGTHDDFFRAFCNVVHLLERQDDAPEGEERQTAEESGRKPMSRRERWESTSWDPENEEYVDDTLGTCF